MAIKLNCIMLNSCWLPIYWASFCPENYDHFLLRVYTRPLLVLTQFYESHSVPAAHGSSCIISTSLDKNFPWPPIHVPFLVGQSIILSTIDLRRDHPSQPLKPTANDSKLNTVCGIHCSRYSRLLWLQRPVHMCSGTPAFSWDLLTDPWRDVHPQGTDCDHWWPWVQTRLPPCQYQCLFLVSQDYVEKSVPLLKREMACQTI